MQSISTFEISMYHKLYCAPIDQSSQKLDCGLNMAFMFPLKIRVFEAWSSMYQHNVIR